jgi:ribokinase
MTISILGIYVADLVFFGKKIPVEGETILGSNFVIGPGGKGSNQAVAAAKAGATTYFISKIGDDQFGQMATKIYDEANVNSSYLIVSKSHSTGAAAIMVNEQSGANAINVFPGAAGDITNIDIDKAENAIKNSKIFLTQLEVPKETVIYAIKKAKEFGVKTILNPAPAAEIDKSIFPFIDYFTPNETEASFYVNHPVETHDDARKAAATLLKKGIKNVIITLGDKGAYFANAHQTFSSPISNLSKPVVDTTGAGDAFNAGFAVALTENQNIREAIAFASATAGLSTTKIGTANSMPSREEIDKIL